MNENMRWILFTSSFLVFVVLAVGIVLLDLYRRRFRRLSVYVAGGSSERLEIVRPLIEQIQAAGIDVHDWTRDPNWDLVDEPSRADCRRAARLDLDAVRRCDVFWLVVPAKKSEGASAELGIAIALEKRIIVSGEVGARNIFALLARPGDVFASHEEALARVVEICGAERVTLM